MQITCAWCNCSLGEDSIVPSGPLDISHGICPACSIRLCMNEPVVMKEFLNKLDAPVFAINSDGLIISGNDLALQSVNKPLDDVAFELGGNVMGCVFAELPGGCGNTIHCAGCSIRNLVLSTHKTGVGFTKAPAYLYVQLKKDVQKIDFQVSTERVNSIVLFRIDNMDLGERMDFSEAVDKVAKLIRHA
jgi:hypothetical protein